MSTLKPKVKVDSSAQDSALQEYAKDRALSIQVLRKFRMVFNAVKSHFQQVEKKVGIGGAQVWALSIIHATPGIGVNALATAMDIHQTTASNLVKSLVKMQLLQIEKNAPDKRSVQLYVLPKGQQVLMKAPGPFSGVLPHALNLLDKNTLKRLDTDLEQLLQILDTDDKNALIPLGVAD
jgi:DNA-binding MarR family transcriptional regulator